MRLKYAYCLATAYFKPHECDRIIAYCSRQPLGSGGTAKGTDPSGTKRRSDIAWAFENDATKWIYDRVGRCVETANRQYWRWAMDGHETLQFTTYGPGQYYEWHTDAASRPYPADSLWPGMTRKISVTVQLTAPEDYDGGDFMLEDNVAPPERAAERIRTLTEARVRGTVIMFPSHLFHRVTEVTRGKRRSLVGWYLGRPFV